MFCDRISYIHDKYKDIILSDNSNPPLSRRSYRVTAGRPGLATVSSLVECIAVNTRIRFVPVMHLDVLMY